MIVMIDSNEKATNPKIVTEIKKTFPNAKIKKLSFGDVNIVLDSGDLLSIERKEASDFLGSIADGRLFRQVEAMSQGSKWCAIVVQGLIGFDSLDMVTVNNKVTNWHGASVRGAMMTVQWSGCPIFFTASYPGNFVGVMVEAIKLCSKPDIHYQGLGRKRVITFPPISIAEEILCAFPGIGLQKARALTNYVKDMHRVKEASLGHSIAWATNLLKLAYKSRPPGWGDKLIVQFRLQLGLMPNEYLVVETDIKEKQNVKTTKPKKRK